MTFQDMIQKVILRLSMVPGTGTQIYAEDRIGDMIQHKFTVAFDEAFWSQFMFTNTYTLDGSTGVVTANLTDVLKSFEDILYVWPEDADKPIPVAPERLNPNRVSGDTIKFYEPYGLASKVFKVLSYEATGNIVVRGRTKPDDFAVSDETNVPFDSECLILGACYDYLEDDGTNPGATEKFRILFESRLEQLKRKRNAVAIPLNPGSNDGIPTTWHDQ